MKENLLIGKKVIYCSLATNICLLCDWKLMKGGNSEWSHLDSSNSQRQHFKSNNVFTNHTVELQKLILLGRKRELLTLCITNVSRIPTVVPGSKIKSKYEEHLSMSGIENFSHFLTLCVNSSGPMWLSDLPVVLGGSIWSNPRAHAPFTPGSWCEIAFRAPMFDTVRLFF